MELFTVQHKFKALLIMGWGCLSFRHPFSPLKSNFVHRSGNVAKWSMYRSTYVPKMDYVPKWSMDLNLMCTTVEVDSNTARALHAREKVRKTVSTHGD